MRAVVIHGIMHKGSTYHCVHIFLEELQKLLNLEVTEFFLPGDMPHFCVGCYSCFYKGEDHCPHYEAMKPIEEAIEAADLVVLSSPGYVLNISGAMKAFLDHLGFRWMPHRPHPSMFRKVGVAFCTAAGAGAKKAVNTMRDNFTFWGLRRGYVFRKNVAAMRWQDVKPKLQQRIRGDAQKLAKRTANALKKANKLPVRPFTRLIFFAMMGAQKKNDYNPTDRAHWEKNGWLAGKSPF